MSAMQREALKTKIGIPPLPPRAGGQLGSSGGMRGGRRRKDYTPVSWDKYFEHQEEIKVSETKIFRVYRSGSCGPVILLLHGGGHSALSWAVFTVAVSRLCHCTVVAIDLRGHGDTRTDNDTDLSANTLARDVGDVIHAMFEDDAPPILLMGHSMGGAIAVHVSVLGLLPTLAGLAVIDVVEGTALEALSSMQSFLRSRPKHFSSLEEGIEWSIRSGQISNVESAKVSVGGQLILDESESTAEHAQTHPPPLRTSDPISEEGGEVNSGNDPSSDQTEQSVSTEPLNARRYVWRIDLSKTECYWEGWFKNMSQLFLSCPVPKLLLIAGVDRLDRDLTVGQMQGKFQMYVLRQCGHCVQEDAPDKVAEVIVAFLLRHKLVTTREEFQRPMPAC